jgi:BCD family chlorophyll transporter-like MFS transporter
VGSASAALAFLLVGAGMQMVQTAGLALAADLAPERVRPRVVAFLYTMLMIGMVGFGTLFGVLLDHFTPTRLVQVVQGSAVLTVLLNFAAAWQQEPRRASTRRAAGPALDFRATFERFARTGRTLRFMVTVGLGTAAFNMQDIILEPYGGEVLQLTVGQTTMLTALMAIGALAGFICGARAIGRGADANRVSAAGVLIGLVAFSAVIFAEPLGAPALFRTGALLIGMGGGLFAHGTLTYAMGLDHGGLNGLALGAWGAVQATVAGVSIALGGALRDLVSALANSGALGSALVNPATGYSFVYHLELALLFATLIAIGPLVRSRPALSRPLAELPDPRHP